MKCAARGVKMPIRLRSEVIPGVEATMIHPEPGFVVLKPDGEHIEMIFVPPDVASYYVISIG